LDNPLFSRVRAMQFEILTRQNMHYSRLTNELVSDPDISSNEGRPAAAEDKMPAASIPLRAGNCMTVNQIPDEVAALVKASITEGTRRVYNTDWSHFTAWGGRLPAEPSHVACYIATHADNLSVATLVRRVGTISRAHEAKGLPNPCRSALVRATLQGIKRTLGVAQRQAKPLLREDLFRVLDTLGERMKDARDRALLLIGFAGGFRRSEVVGLNCEDVDHVRQGLIVTLRRTKTDQEGVGRKIGIPFGRTRYCPVLALDRWLAVSGIEAGPIFVRVRRLDYETRIALEVDRFSCRTIRLNRPAWSLLEGDFHEITSETILDKAQLKTGEADILIGGPPCQPFSKSSYWVRGDSLRLGDPRANTLTAYLRVLRDTRPRAFLLENVGGRPTKARTRDFSTSSTASERLTASAEATTNRASGSSGARSSEFHKSVSGYS